MFDSNQFVFGFGRRMRLFLQTEETECGMACVAMVANYHGYRTSLLELRQRFSISMKGTTFAGLAQIAQSLGMSTRPVKVDMPNLSQLKLPCILHWNFNHYVVLSSVNSRSITIYDPSAGVRQVRLADVSRLFTGVAIELWPGEQFIKKKAGPQFRLRDLLGNITGWESWLAKLILLGITIEIFGLTSPLFLQWIVDDVIVTGDKDLLTTLAIGYLIILLVQQSVVTLRAWGVIYFSTSLGLQWRANVLTHLLSLPVAYFERRHLGDVVSRFSSVDQIQRTISTSALETILDGLMTVVTLAMMFIYSPTMTLVGLIAVVLYGVMRSLLYRYHREALQDAIIQSARQDSQILETLRGIKTIKLFQRQNERRSTWVNAYIEKINADLRAQRLELAFKIGNGLIGGLANIAVLCIGALLVVDQHITAGVLLAFLAYKTQFDSRIVAFIGKMLELRMLGLQVDRVADIVLTDREPEMSTSIRPDVLTVPSIELKNLCFRYSEQEPFVLNEISLFVKPGESVVITGKSGCGKSTLLNILLGILSPTTGGVMLDGVLLTSETVQDARAIIGSVLQDDVLFAGSIASNISFFDPDVDVEWVMECSRHAAIYDDIMAMPMRFETLVGDMGTILSGGQKQRVLLARALYKRPKILILDEATSFLDSSSESCVNRSISRLQITRIIVAHRMETIASAARRIVIHGGRIIEDVQQDQVPMTPMPDRDDMKGSYISAIK